MTYKQVDDIVSLGKWVYAQIPKGDHCRSCPLLHKDSGNYYWYCSLRPGLALIHDGEKPFKDRGCPVERD